MGAPRIEQRPSSFRLRLRIALSSSSSSSSTSSWGRNGEGIIIIIAQKLPPHLLCKIITLFLTQNVVYSGFSCRRH